jgi:3-methyladenine DNA glycosylase AlkC
MAASVPQEGQFVLIYLISTSANQLVSRASHSRECYQVRLPSRHVSHMTVISFNSIRNRLTALKKDRVEYIKPSDVNSLYQAVVKQGTSLHIYVVIYR